MLSQYFSNIVYRISGDREEFKVNAERLMCRCLTVDIKVGIPRTTSQEEALTATNKFLEEIQQHITSSLHSAAEMLQGLFNACNPDEEGRGTVNIKFQSLILACAVEDQKKIRKRIQKWSNAIQSTSKTFL